MNINHVKQPLFFLVFKLSTPLNQEASIIQRRFFCANN